MDIFSGIQEPSAVFFGLIIGSVLFGVVLLESYRYFQIYKSDSLWLKLLVALLCGLDGLLFALSIYIAYYTLVATMVDNPLVIITKLFWSGKVLATVQILMWWMVQCLYLIRIHMLSKKTLLDQKQKLPVYCMIAVIAIASLGTGLYMIVIIDNIGSLVDFQVNLQPVEMSSSLGVIAAIDIVISAIMITLLRRSVTGIKRTDGVLAFLVYYFFSAGLLTSLTAVAILILYVIGPERFLYGGMTLFCARFYTISLLELLNVRKQLRKNMDQAITLEPLGSMKFKAASDSQTSPSASPNDVDCQV